MATATKPKIKAIAPWFGGNRTLAQHVGKSLDGCNWVGIPFAGGMAEISHIRAREIVANDLHRGVISLASQIAKDAEGLQEHLRSLIFHPDTLSDAQSKIGFNLEENAVYDERSHAIAFFIVAWMTRSGTAGTDGELTGKLCLRWSATGGGSATRWQSAIDSLPYWAEELKRCTFSTLDCFEFLKKCKDRPKHGIYCDPPFPGAGDKYTHKFTERHHQVLAATLADYQHTRVVCRYYDHPMIRELYPASRWTWRHLEGRKQNNESAPEVLLSINTPT